MTIDPVIVFILYTLYNQVMAEVSGHESDDAWKEFKTQLKSSGMVTSAGAYLVAQESMKDQRITNKSGKVISLKEVARSNDGTNNNGTSGTATNAWSRRLSMVSVGTPDILDHISKRFGAGGDDNKSTSFLPAAGRSRSLTPPRSPTGKHENLKRRGSNPESWNQPLTPPPRFEERPKVHRRASSEWIGSEWLGWHWSDLPNSLSAREASESKRCDTLTTVATTNEHLVIRSYESTEIKIFNQDSGVLLEDFGSRGKRLLEDFGPRRSSMDVSPRRSRRAHVSRRSSMDDRLSLSPNRVPVTLAFSNRRSTMDSVVSEATLSDDISESSELSLNDLFPKRKVELEDSYVKGLLLLAPNRREASIRNIMSRHYDDSSDLS